MVIVIQDTVEDLSGRWQFAKAVMGTDGRGLCFFKWQLLLRSLGLRAIDVIITDRGSLF